MNTYSQKTPDKNHSLADERSQKKSSRESSFQFADNRPEAIAQRKLRDGINNSVVQRQAVIQLLTNAELEEWSEFSAAECDWMTDAEKEQLGKYKEKKAADAKYAKESAAAIASIEEGMGYKSWTYAGVKYHVNMKLGTYHITEEAVPKIHYFFQGSGDTISDKQPTKKEKGDHGTVFSKLPPNVQRFIKENWARL